MQSTPAKVYAPFDWFEVEFSAGVNIIIGENGTGKTHLLKVIYSACDVTKTNLSFAEKLNRVFLPSGEQIGRLVKRKNVSSIGCIEVTRVVDNDKMLTTRLSFSNHTKVPSKAKSSGASKQWRDYPLESVYIPVKDMMANAPGFRSLYSLRHIHFEEVYSDVIDRVFLNSLKGPVDEKRKRLLKILEGSMVGKITSKGEEFFLKNDQGQLEFTLLAEGVRKLGLLWVLIQNGTLLNGSVLLWDEPETNLNPKLMRTVVEILVELQRMGVQIFITTHNYSILKEFDLQTGPEDKVLFHSLFKNEKASDIECNSCKRYSDVLPNAIDDAFGGFVDREIDKSMGGLGK
ncbi:MAG: ATP-binding protein [Alphaproteobacteria bacterium]|nr:ATP-binding protein [Alphaproteobacteria bacterium]